MSRGSVVKKEAEETPSNAISSRRRDSYDNALGDRDDRDRSSEQTSSSRRSQNSKARGRENNQDDDLPDYDDLTKQVVAKLKEKLQRKNRNPNEINEELIEVTVAQIRKDEILQKENNDEWEEKLRRGVPKCPDVLLDVSRAYGDDPKRVAAILQAKLDNPRPANTTDENKDPNAVELAKAIDTLKKYKKFENPTALELVGAVLKMDDTDIDRADRMFYSHARSLINDDKYTYDHAHDQVQAIRLMGYEIDDEDDLVYFIKNCRNFDAAYSCLKKLAIDRVKKSETNSTTSRTSPNATAAGGRRDDYDDREGNRNRSLVNSYTPEYTSLSQQSDHSHGASNYRDSDRRSMNPSNNSRKADSRDDPPYQSNYKYNK